MKTNWLMVLGGALLLAAAPFWAIHALLYVTIGSVPLFAILMTATAAYGLALTIATARRLWRQGDAIFVVWTTLPIALVFGVFTLLILVDQTPNFAERLVAIFYYALPAYAALIGMWLMRLAIPKRVETAAAHAPPVQGQPVGA